MCFTFDMGLCTSQTNKFMGTYLSLTLVIMPPIYECCVQTFNLTWKVCNVNEDIQISMLLNPPFNVSSVWFDYWFIPWLGSFMDRLGFLFMNKEIWKEIVLGLEFSFAFCFPILWLWKMVQNRLVWHFLWPVSWL